MLFGGFQLCKNLSSMMSVLSIPHYKYFQEKKKKNSCFCHPHSLPKILELCFRTGVVRMTKSSTENMPPPKAGSKLPLPAPQPAIHATASPGEFPGRSRQNLSIRGLSLFSRKLPLLGESRNASFPNIRVYMCVHLPCPFQSRTPDREVRRRSQDEIDGTSSK